MKYNWQHESWPNFQFSNESVAEHQSKFDVLYARAEAILRSSTPTERANYALESMTKEALKTSEIEGERLAKADVQFALLNHFNKAHLYDVKDERAKGVAALMIDVKDQQGKSLSEETLKKWQTMIVTAQQSEWSNIQRGQYRSKDMQIVSGPIGHERVEYEAPPPERVKPEMDRFIDWYNNDQQTPTLAKAAISHLYFETIHPFDDGNGRVGRAIVEHALISKDGKDMYLSLSNALQRDRNSYYEQLNLASKGNNTVDQWVDWFSRKVAEAQKEANRDIGFIIEKSRFWAQHENKDINERQRKVIKKVFNYGVDGFPDGIKGEQYRKMAKTSKPTATKDLDELVQHGMLVKDGVGRATRYKLATGHL